MHSPTVRIYIFDGTWCDRYSLNNRTILGSLVDLLQSSAKLESQESRREIRCFPGVGTRNGIIDRCIDGGLGRGVKECITQTIDDLTANYHDGDTVVFLGYSRGAFIARSVVGFLDRLGLPDCNRDVLFELYKKYTSGEFLKRDVPERLARKYNCKRITIKSLICIDTVGTLGVPKTGIFGLLRLFSNSRAPSFMEVNMASNVENASQLLALNEQRGPFPPTLMQKPTCSTQSLKQVWVLGSHKDVGMDRESGSLGDIVFAWALGQLDSIGIRFDDERTLEKLRMRFPHAGASRPLSDVAAQEFVHDPIQQSYTGLWPLMGRHIRRPGQLPESAEGSQESIHSTVRLRGYGTTRNHDAIDGFSVSGQSDGTFLWEQSTEASGVGLTGPISIPEEPMGGFEAWLHGVLPTP